MEQVHQLMLEAFVGPAPNGHVCRHKDGNGLNNRLENLSWATQQENADDRVRDGATTGLRANVSKVASITFVGEEMTYDLEVAGPWHNFSVGGMVVHNSLNEYSGRYSKMPMLFYNPKKENMGLQSKKNRQGRAESISDDAYEGFILGTSDVRTFARNHYEECLHQDIARELARIDLPLSTYTYWCWKMDLHNLLHFLGLRSDPHAQWEIRQYSDIIAGMVKRIAPDTFEAWVDYEFRSATFSRQEMRALQSMLEVFTRESELDPKFRRHLSTKRDTVPIVTCQQLESRGMSRREMEEFFDKFEADYSNPDFNLDLSAAKPPEHFAELIEKAVPVGDR